jgi:hypothetical protein
VQDHAVCECSSDSKNNEMAPPPIGASHLVAFQAISCAWPIGLWQSVVAWRVALRSSSAWRRYTRGWLSRGGRCCRRRHDVGRSRLIWLNLARRERHGLRVGVATQKSRPRLCRIKVARWRRRRSRRRRRLDSHRPHPRSLGRRLSIGPGEVGTGWEVLNVIVHVPARGQGHASVFDLAAGRGQDPAHRQR